MDGIKEFFKENKYFSIIFAILLAVLEIKGLLSIDNNSELLIIGGFILVGYIIIQLFNKKNKKIRKITQIIGSLFIILMTFSSLMYNNPTFNLLDMEKIREQKYERLLAQGLLQYSRENYRDAISVLEKAQKYALPDDLQDINLWEAEILSRNNQQEKAYIEIMSYYKENIEDYSSEDLDFLGITSLISLLNQGKFEELSKKALIMYETSKIPMAQELKMLALAKMNKKYELQVMFDSYKPTLIAEDYYNTIYYEIFNTIGSYFHGCGDYSRTLVALMLGSKNRQEYMEMESSTYYADIANLTTMSLSYKKSIQKFYTETVQLMIENNNQLYNLYKNDIVNFGLEIGSIEALKYKLSEYRPNLSSKIDQAISKYFEGETFITVELINNGKNIDILCITGKPFKSGDLELDEMEFLDKAYCKLISICDEDIVVKDIKGWEIDSGLTTFYYRIEAVNNKTFLLIDKAGSGEYSDFHLVDSDKCEIKNIESVNSEDTYHSYDINYLKENEKIILTWKFELLDYNIANAERKVVAIAKQTIDLNGNIIDYSIRYLNPALEIYQSINKEKNIKSNYLLNKVKIQGSEILDETLKQILTNSVEVRYLRTKIDETFNYMPESVTPKISVLLLGLANEQIEKTNNREEDIEEVKYIILVRKGVNDIDIINIYKLENDKLLCVMK
jgi:hypothetical protein